MCIRDSIRSDRGPLLLEVNSSPGLEGVEDATGFDVAGMMIQSIERQLRPSPKAVPDLLNLPDRLSTAMDADKNRWASTG